MPFISCSWFAVDLSYRWRNKVHDLWLSGISWYNEFFLYKYKNWERCTKILTWLCGLKSHHQGPKHESRVEPDWSWSYFPFLYRLHCSWPWKPGIKQASSSKMICVLHKSCVFKYLIETCILIVIQFPEIVLIVRKCAGKDGFNLTWKCTSALLNMIRCHSYKVCYLSWNLTRSHLKYTRGLLTKLQSWTKFIGTLV